MRNNFDYKGWYSQINYKVTNVLSDIKIHCISSKYYHPELISVSLSTNFGAADLSFIGTSNEEIKFPQGLAHFLEHFLMWQAYNSSIRELEYDYGAFINAVVTLDRITWFIKACSVNVEQIELDIIDIVKKLILIAVPKNLSLSDKLIRHSIEDVIAEIRYRKSNLDYLMQVKLLENLYSRHPIRHDILGTETSVRGIQKDVIELALKLISSQITSLIVVGHELPYELPYSIEQLLEKLLAGKEDDSKLTPFPINVDQDKVSKKIEGLYLNLDEEIDFSIVKLGIRLPPFSPKILGVKEFDHYYLLNLLLTRYIRNPISCINSRHARIYILTSRVGDSLFYLDPQSVDDFRSGQIQKTIDNFKKYQEHFSLYTEDALSKIIESRFKVMQMCYYADLFNRNLSDIFEAFNLICPEDINYFINELSASKINIALVYASPYVGVL